MDSEEIRKRFLEFFAKPEHGKHTVVLSSSLIPDDPSVLLTTAGMQQFKPYFVGKADPMKDFGSKNTASIQKSFRTSDIDEVGDESHLTFFEMLGNFSFGGYFKKEAIEYAHEFITKEMNLKIDYVSVFKGDEDVPADEESERIWKSLGVKEIKRMGRADNFWGPTGSEGPCGPTTEIYVKGLEVWNIVFNEYYCKTQTVADNTQADAEKFPRESASSPRNSALSPLKVKGVDTGMGLERLAMVSQNVPTIFETDLFAPLTSVINTPDRRIQRILADHARAAAHLVAEGVEPSNKDRGYILRRLLRRLIYHVPQIAGADSAIPLAQRDNLTGWDERHLTIIHDLFEKVIECDVYGLDKRRELIHGAVKKEAGKFIDLMKSQHELVRFVREKTSSGTQRISGEEAFKIFSSYGPPIDYIKDVAQAHGLDVDVEGFEQAFEKHREISRAGQEKKFGGHGLILNTGELKAGDERELAIVTRLHTATHLLQAALRAVLGNEVKQMGSDITAERTRFDFAFPRKLTPEEIKKVEEWVNDVVKKDLPMQYEEMDIEKAKKTGALFFFKEKYPEKVKVYYVGKSISGAVSKEFCGGPHVTHTGEIGKFRIAKEEAVGAGVRRIRGVVDPHIK